VPENIEVHRDPEALRTGRFAEDILYFLQLSFFRRFLHTGEVRGSNIPYRPPILFKAAVLQVFEKAALNGERGERSP